MVLEEHWTTGQATPGGNIYWSARSVAVSSMSATLFPSNGGVSSSSYTAKVRILPEKRLSSHFGEGGNHPANLKIIYPDRKHEEIQVTPFGYGSQP
jgi:hypothetical protein